MRQKAEIPAKIRTSGQKEKLTLQKCIHRWELNAGLGKHKFNKYLNF